MSRYALIMNGLVNQFYETDGDTTTMFHPALIWVNVDAWPAVEAGWIAEKIDGSWKFRPWTISPEEILRINILDQAYKLNIAKGPMSEALLGAKMCYYDTSGTTQLAKQWQEYHAAVLAMDLTIENPEWPTPPTV